MKKITRAKAHGVHYTPPDLAKFLAQVVWKHFVCTEKTVRVLDPACGDGALLRAVAETAPHSVRRNLVLVGYETDPSALARAGHILADIKGEVALSPVDFLSLSGIGSDCGPEEPSLFDNEAVSRERAPQFDVVIANPPYVRTQVLGSKKAQALAQRFHLTGRVDLYQAFVKAMAGVLRPHGILGLLTSNRFLFVQSGAAIRHLLTTQFGLKAIYDLGDTKLFAAAVLPVIVVAGRGRSEAAQPCTFDRVYEARAGADGLPISEPCNSVLDALRNDLRGLFSTPEGRFIIERGMLAPRTESKARWFLQTSENERWLHTVRSQQACAFGDVGRIRVGIKTTADCVFIRDDWSRLLPSERPEPALLRPIMTHEDATRWSPQSKQTGSRLVLYPHEVRHGKRQPISLEGYPRARAYLEGHRAKLMLRKYVLEAGRQWYEIWVPQDPEAWSQPKLVFPDIAENPSFFLDRSGAIVDGDCYWLTLKPGKHRRWLLLMLAVANSSFILKYYDTVFHNKLYSGRRRFMMQYVKEFPLPKLSLPATRRAIVLVSKIVKEGMDARERRSLETAIDDAVWESFGLAKEACG